MATQTGLLVDKGFKALGMAKVRRADLDEVGFRVIGNNTVFDVTPATKSSERAAFYPGMRGQFLDSDVQIESTTLKITVDTIGRENMALAFMATDSDFTQAEATAQEKVFTAAVLDRWFELDRVNVSNVVVTQGSTTLVAETDYYLDADNGQILFRSTGDCVAGDAVTVQFDCAAVTGGYVLDVATLPNIELEIIFTGHEFIGDRNIKAHVFKWKPSPTSAMKLLSPDEYVTLELEGKMLTPEGQTKPMQVHVWDRV